MSENELATIVFNRGLMIHKALGVGLLESAYLNALYYELEQQYLNVKKHVKIPAVYKDLTLDEGYEIDLLIEDKLIVTVKTVDSITSLHKAQLLAQLKANNKKLGLIINFNTVLFKDGVKRMVNGQLA